MFSQIRKLLWPIVLTALIATAVSVMASPAPAPTGTTASEGVYFVHTATTANIVSNWTYLDHPLLNGNPDAIFVVMPTWNPSGTSGVYNAHAIGVWYNSSKGQWAVFNQDLSAMTVGAKFNVFIPNSSTIAFVHQVAAGSSSAVTYLNNAQVNDNPDLILLVTPNWNPSGAAGVYNNHQIGVYFYGNAGGGGSWAIFNQDGANLPAGASFNVVALPLGDNAFEQRTSASNTALHTTLLEHPLADDNPDALLFASFYGKPSGVGNDHPTAMMYVSGSQQWGIINQDLAAMPQGVTFQVYVAPQPQTAFVHQAESNPVGDATFLDHPLLNGNPSAIAFITPNWNPAGSGGVYNDHATGLYYTGSYFSPPDQWGIFNQDKITMTANAAFNVFVPPPSLRTFVHKATTSNLLGHITYLDHPMLNQNPNAILFVTPNWNPGGTASGTYNDHPIGVWYDGLRKQWSIFNQDGVTMTVNTAFNVFVATDLSNVFVHTATVTNTVSNVTYLDHPSLNGNPAALVLVTPNWTGVYNAHHIGVYYSTGMQRWAIFNQDLSNMPEGASFNVLVVSYRTFLPLVLR